MEVLGIRSTETARADQSAAATAFAQWTAREQAENRELVKAVQAVNASGVLGAGHELTFAIDRESRRVVARVVDRSTREVILQIPDERLLRMAASLPKS